MDIRGRRDSPLLSYSAGMSTGNEGAIVGKSAGHSSDRLFNSSPKEEEDEASSS